MDINDMDEVGTAKYIARERVVGAALSLVSARHYADIHPENPHGGDNVDLHNDVLDDALTEYVKASQSVTTG